MAITAYTGPPGAGKSYAMISQVIVPAVAAGRRVVTNIDGVEPAKVRKYADKSATGDLGDVVLFYGEEAKKPGFFPTEEISDENTFVKGGDLLVFDEWRLYFPRRGQHPNADLEKFLRWHRHLTDEEGRTCDVVIGTQLATDVHGDYRGLIERSYKFRKLSALGMKKTYQYDVFEGHLQPKGGQYDKGNGRYKKEVFALYSSYDGGVDAKEKGTDARATIWSKGLAFGCAGMVAALGVCAYGVYSFFTSATEALPVPEQAPLGFAPVMPSNQPQQAPLPSSRWRIVGQLVGDEGPLVVVSDGTATRLLEGSCCEFRKGRPVAGNMNGQAIYAEDRVHVSRDAGMIELAP
ncbi:zonular occludens toxin domain-containing protein [Erythrobacter ani]|uniref:Zona occludens toxin N-terminal domain-containing protein n=1 Tax=Erythrobacter ani TaxID=2827235 RepID=A0ABS6SRW0_9SPHN|nr:zonular occludens toxin domain-containing protein [Erythrobacter ani]MBV7267561.1 hypothetical protein [Erythrobacter ani]